MEAAAAAKGDVKILAVTVLTSLDRGDLDDLGFACDVEQLVLSRARRALDAGCDGVVSSGLEAPMLRASIDDRAARRDARHPPGREPARGRPEARRDVAAGVRATAPTTSSSAGRSATLPTRAPRRKPSRTRSPASFAAAHERRAAERPAAARAAARADAPHARLDDAPGGPLPARVPRDARERPGSFLQPLHEPRPRLRGDAAAARRVIRLDAAILFSDILTMPHAMGLGLDVRRGRRSADSRGRCAPRPTSTGCRCRTRARTALRVRRRRASIRRELAGRVP